MEYDSDFEGTSVTDSQRRSDLYTLEGINMFLLYIDETFGKSVKINDYFPDAEK